MQDVDVYVFEADFCTSVPPVSDACFSRHNLGRVRAASGTWQDGSRWATRFPVSEKETIASYRKAMFFALVLVP